MTHPPLRAGIICRHGGATGSTRSAGRPRTALARGTGDIGVARRAGGERPCAETGLAGSGWPPDRWPCPSPWRHRCHVTVLRAPGPDQCVRGPRRLHGSPGRGGGAHRHPVRRLDASLHRHRGDPSCRAPGGLRPNHRGRPHPERGVLEADLVRSSDGTWTRFSESGQRNLARTPPTPEPDSLFEPLDQEPVAPTRTRPPRSTTPPPRDPSPRRRVRRSPGCPARSRRS